ncbi:MAG: glycosyltransferase family 2 protein, partial [Prevotella sp.]|nr:glycosyltransferase family 2 protein [Prevotella sp.]
FYAFSDQDDYWEKDKLEVATNSLQQYSERPALYFSRTQLVDAELHPTQNIAINPLLTFGESLIYEFIPGCTIVMNRQMRDLINTYTPDYLPMHDVWVYCIAQAVRGKIIFDKTPHILYRQHENNTIGQGYSRWHEWHRRWNRFLNNEQSRYRRAYELRKGFGKVMPAENLQLLDLFIAGKTNFYKRGGMVLDKRLRCANSTTQKLFWLNLLINKY